MDNNFLKNLDSTQVREIVDCVYERRVKTGQFVIKEGDPGQHFYVAAGGLPLTHSALVGITSVTLCQGRQSREGLGG